MTDLKTKLTKKQEIFCIEHVKGGNASAAYRLAYNTENMTNESIKVKASELLKNGNVTVTIDVLKKRAKKIILDKFDYDIKKLFKKLISWLEADITQTINVSPEELKNLPKDIRQLIVNYKHTKLKLDNGAKETIELKFVSKEKAAEMMAKHLGFYSANNSQKDEVIIVNEGVSGYTIYDPTKELRE